ncbi:hypothetical protein QZH41_014042 [Actinostola sp. cb2023]|nr:hypothetical protein QZH41_014042 [Actinostola sp. cb2023]
MAAKCAVQTTNGEEELGEDDDDWSDFASDSNNISPSTCVADRSEQKCFPSKDSSWVFDSVSEKARLCFPESSLETQRSSRDRLNETPNNRDLKENPELLEENLCFTSYFPQPVWKGSNFESALIQALDLLTTVKGEEQESEVEIKREPGLFNFHHLAERTMDFWQSSTKWNMGRVDESVEDKRSRESVLNENSETKINDFTGDLEIWTDSDGADSDEFFSLVGDQEFEESRSLEDSHAAAGLHQLAFEEVQELSNEMATYVKEYSDSLVEELIVKDEQLREKEIKNSFISSLLALQSKLRDVQSAQGKKKIGPSANKVK